jgi:hypothetical protein
MSKIYKLSSIFFTAFFISISIFAQDKQPAKPELRKGILGFNFSPEISYRRISPDYTKLGSTQWADYRDKVNSAESSKTGSTFGINVGNRFNEKLSFESGLYFSFKGFKQNLSQTTPNSFLRQQVIANYKINYFDFPLELNYRTGIEKTKFLIAYGLVINRLAIAKIEFSEQVNIDKTLTSSIKLTDNYKKLNLSTTFGFGFDTEINENFGIRLKTQFRYGLFSAQKQDYPRIHYDHLWTIGLNLNLYFNV